jgi:two-component system, NtrC family, response regulator GlrR
LALIENELFGHRRGAFTDAVTSERGVIQEADGGTLFFDEIDSLSLGAQVKLLRFLQEKEFKPLGSAKIVRSDVRIIVATSVDLERAIHAGQFRRDLYYRLNVLAINLPPLKERRVDIPLLARHFLAKYAEQFGKKAASFSAEANQTLLFHDWPGNVRELENVVMRALILSEGPIIEQSAIRLLEGSTASHPESFREAKERLIGEFEKSYLQELLLNFHGNVSHAAKAAKKDRRSFWQLVRKHKIDVQEFRTKTLGVNAGPQQ